MMFFDILRRPIIDLMKILPPMMHTYFPTLFFYSFCESYLQLDSFFPPSWDSSKNVNIGVLYFAFNTGQC